MDFSNIALFNVMRTKLHYMSERQGVLAQNIANADTPNYEAKDITAPDFKKLAAGNSGSGSLPMAVTHSNHLTGAAAANGKFSVIKRPDTYERSPTDNNVVIEEEMMKVAQNQAEYQKVLNLYKKTIDMFKTAIGRPSAGG